MGCGFCGCVAENIGKPMNAYCGHDCLEDVIIDDDTSSLEAFLNDDTDNGGEMLLLVIYIACVCYSLQNTMLRILDI